MYLSEVFIICVNQGWALCTSYIYFRNNKTLPLLFFQVPLVAVDSFYYGKVVLAPLNIVLYNVFGKGGPELYGEFRKREEKEEREIGSVESLS